MMIIFNCDPPSNSSKNGGKKKSSNKSSNVILTPEINVKIDDIEITNGTLDYIIGSVLVGNQKDITFSIENTDSANLTLLSMLSITLSGDNEFTLKTDASIPVISGNYTTFVITFTPTTIGDFTTSISITNNDANENIYNFSIKCSSMSIIEPEINIKEGAKNIQNNTKNYNIGSIPKGTNMDIEFTVENTGTTDLNLSGSHIVKITDPDNVFTLKSDAVSPVNENGYTTFIIRFSPVEKSNYECVIIINNNDSDENPYTFSLKGRGSN